MRRPSMDQARLMTRQESDRDRRRRSSVSLDNALGQASTSPRPDTPVPQGLPVEGGEPSEMEAAEPKPKATAKLPAPGAVKQDSKGRTIQYA